MEDDITLEQLTAWHQQRAKDCLATIARATYVPKQQRDAIISTAHFHQAAARLLLGYQLY